MHVTKTPQIIDKCKAVYMDKCSHVSDCSTIAVTEIFLEIFHIFLRNASLLVTSMAIISALCRRKYAMMRLLHNSIILCPDLHWQRSLISNVDIDFAISSAFRRNIRKSLGSWKFVFYISKLQFIY